jgi:hypothetical protein
MTPQNLATVDLGDVCEITIKPARTLDPDSPISALSVTATAWPEGTPDASVVVVVAPVEEFVKYAATFKPDRAGAWLVRVAVTGDIEGVEWARVRVRTPPS